MASQMKLRGEGKYNGADWKPASAAPEKPTPKAGSVIEKLKKAGAIEVIDNEPSRFGN